VTGQAVFFACFFRARDRFHFASAFRTSSFETVNILRTALSKRSASVLPGTFGAGVGFIGFYNTPFQRVAQSGRELTGF